MPEEFLLKSEVAANLICDIEWNRTQRIKVYQFRVQHKLISYGYFIHWL